MAESIEKHHRKSIRLQGYDYTQAGAYFLTFVTEGRECLFGEIIAEEMYLNLAGQCAAAVWNRLPHHFPVTLDAWVLMPNHFHAVLVIHDRCRGEASGKHAGYGKTEPLPDASPLRLLTDERPNGTVSGSLGAIVQNYKSISTRRINSIQGTPGKHIWQRNYHEHIIRNDDELKRIVEYIGDNPSQWELDPEFYRSGL